MLTNMLQFEKIDFFLYPLKMKKFKVTKNVFLKLTSSLLKWIFFTFRSFSRAMLRNLFLSDIQMYISLSTLNWKIRESLKMIFLVFTFSFAISKLFFGKYVIWSQILTVNVILPLSILKETGEICTITS